MEGDLALMIPIIALCIPFFAIWTKHQRRLAEMQVMAGTSGQAQLSHDVAEKIAALENRVRVLERIVTDANSGLGGSNLAAEIEALRGVEPARPPEKTM